MPQERRVAENQALFREVNERVRALNQAFPVPHTSWVCECANIGCFARVELTPAEYEHVRAHPARFLISPGEGHVAPERERLVLETDRYWVVELVAEASQVADAHDPVEVLAFDQEERDGRLFALQGRTPGSSPSCVDGSPTTPPRAPTRRVTRGAPSTSSGQEHA